MPFLCALKSELFTGYFKKLILEISLMSFYGFILPQLSFLNLLY